MFYYFDELTSTIDEARDEKYIHGDVVVARHQTAGRGQRDRKWISPPGENLMFSVVLDTSFLRISEQLLLLQTVALALVDTFSDHGIDTEIKWPNDIYAHGRKITGVLIDHTQGAGMLKRSGVGIGINVDQTEFEPWLPNPTSMALETGRKGDHDKVLRTFHDYLMSWLERLRSGRREEREEINALYVLKMFRLDTPAKYSDRDGNVFTGTLKGVGPGGELLLKVENNTKSYFFHEISFVI